MKILKFLGLLILLVVVLALGVLAWAFQTANARYNQHWTAHEATFPIPFPLDSTVLAGGNSRATAEARAVERGEHLVQSRLGCMSCHGADFGGGVIIDVPPVGYWAAPNLTAGRGSVTNGFSAHDWDLAVRHGIRHTGTSSTMPCREFEGLSDHELSDVVAYIRSRPPVDRIIRPVRLGPVFAFMAATDPNALPAFTIDHQAAHAVEPPAAEVSLAFGEHLVATCRGCHNPKLSGGKMQGDPNMPIVANLTPDATGLRSWTEADFIRAMREGRRPDGSAIAEAMPWKAYARMTDVELRALWLYLRSVPAVPTGAQ
jgi:mono/diheme cytochrome c family protein